MTTETRYMRSDDIITGYFNLGTSQSSVAKGYEAYYPGSRTVYWGIRVWKRDSSGTETEITAGTPVAQVSRSANGEGLQSATWACPQTPLDPTDRIVVRVYQKIGAGAWVSVTAFTGNSGWATEQLGAIQLDSATWTVYYFTLRDYDGVDTYGDFYWGTSTYNSRIENFSWSSGPPPPAGGILVQII
jgi:hypothetical protein